MTHPDTILLRCGSTVAAVPNSWHTVSTDHFLSIVESLQQLYAGLITPDELLCRYVCRVLHLSLPLIVRKHHADHLLSIARRVTFILTPVQLNSETSSSSSYYYYSQEVVTSVVPYVSKPAMALISLDRAKIKLTFSANTGINL